MALSDGVTCRLVEYSMLQTLRLTNFTLSEQHISAVSKCRQLRNLDLSLCNLPNGAACKLFDLKTLRTLAMPLGLREGEPETFDILWATTPEIRFSSIRMLDFRGSEFTHISPLTGCTLLRKLILRGCNRLADVTSLLGCRTLRNLESSARLRKAHKDFSSQQLFLS